MEKDFIDIFKSKVELTIEQGITIEIKECFRNEDNIESFKVQIIEDKTYLISIGLKEYNKQEIKRIFSEFVNFIQYSYATLYVRNDEHNKIKYSLLSVDKDMVGFYCELNFSLGMEY